MEVSTLIDFKQSQPFGPLNLHDSNEHISCSTYITLSLAPRWLCLPLSLQIINNWHHSGDLLFSVSVSCSICFISTDLFIQQFILGCLLSSFPFKWQKQTTCLLNKIFSDEFCLSVVCFIWEWNFNFPKPLNMVLIIIITDKKRLRLKRVSLTPCLIPNLLVGGIYFLNST